MNFLLFSDVASRVLVSRNRNVGHQSELLHQASRGPLGLRGHKSPSESPLSSAWGKGRLHKKSARFLSQKPLGLQTNAAAAQEQDLTNPETPSMARQDAVPEPSSKGFPWTKAWYPVCVMDSLDAKSPKAVKLLGMNLVVWSDSQGSWNCMEDKCSHRLAPLSEGRVEDGNIMCCYHGWHFDSQGKCTKIPQIDDPKAHAFSCSQQSARINVYPTKVQHGLLWVWPEPGLQGLQESSAAPLRNAIPNDSEQGRWTFPYTWFFRDLPLRFDTLVENLIDISHAPHAHHGVPGMGDRNKPLKLTYTRDSPINQDAGFILNLQMKAQDNGPPPMNVKVSFTPPAFIRHAGTSFSTEIIVVPTEAGWSRVFMNTLLLESKGKSLPLPVLMLGAIKSTFPALDHVILKHAIFDGDTYMLHRAERELLKVNNNWRDNFFMPAQDDLPIVTFRRWLQDHAGDVPTCGPLQTMPPTMMKEMVLDRFQQHTRHCNHCQRAVRTTETFKTICILGVAIFIVGLARGFSTQAALQSTVLLAMTGGAVVCSALWFMLEAFKQNFFYIDYVHAYRG